MRQKPGLINRVAVLFGERHSPHHEHSEESAREVVSALCEGPNEAVSFAPGNHDEWLTLPKVLKKKFQTAFITTHGSHLLPGGVEQLLQDHGIRSSGVSPVVSALTANPYMTASLLRTRALPVPNYYVIANYRFLSDPEPYVAHIRHYFGFPVFVQPVTGVRGVAGLLAQTSDEFFSTAESLLRSYRELVVSAPVTGRLFWCPVMDHGAAMGAFPLMPTPVEGDVMLPESLLSEMRRIAVIVHELLHIRGFSESIVSYSSREGICAMAVNTVPVLHEGGPLRRSLAMMKMSVRTFVEKLIKSAQ